MSQMANNYLFTSESVSEVTRIRWPTRSRRQCLIPSCATIPRGVSPARTPH